MEEIIGNQEILSIQTDDISLRMTESLRNLCTNIRLAGVEKKVLAITSTTSNEGKSTISMYLALTMSEFHKKILLIECDMRKGTLMHRYKIEDETKYGLSHYLSGNCTEDEVIYRIRDERCNSCIDFIPAGEIPPNAAELLSGKRMEEFIKHKKNSYDYIILDCPPVGMVADTAAVLPFCDGAILAIAAGEISKKMVLRAVEEIKKSKCGIVGTILNNADEVLGHSYDYYYKGYYKRYERDYEEYTKAKINLIPINFILEWKNVILLLAIVLLILANGVLYTGKNLFHFGNSHDIAADATTFAEISQTSSTTEQLSVQTTEVLTDEEINNLAPVKVTYIFDDMLESTYNTLYEEMNQDGMTGVFNLRNTILPDEVISESKEEEILKDDPDKQFLININEYSELMENGWSGAISVGLSTEKDINEWKSEVKTYLNKITESTGQTPTVYYFQEGEYRSQCNEILKKLGIKKILCASEDIDKIDADGFTVVPVFDVTSSEEVSYLKRVAWKYPGAIVRITLSDPEQTTEDIRDVINAVENQSGLQKSSLNDVIQAVQEDGEERAALVSE